MTTATALIDVDEPLERTIRLVSVAERPEPAPAAPAPSEADRSRTRPAHCRYAMHFED
ncbi:hypothetical protein ACFXDE_34975 [Kitasatospora sp. NPDC059408]|uniref:hypothetical protein n=1 Tax=Kitasatospora sp. NPDC059408 TaxID=3346823 RepID=UPI00368025AA